MGSESRCRFRRNRAAERDDRVDVVSRGLLGLTVACARCHDHKYDPISQKDYYALAGVFASTDYKEYPLSTQEEIDRFKAHQKKVRKVKGKIQGFLRDQEKTLREILARQTSRYMMAAWEVMTKKLPETEIDRLAAERQVDAETLRRWLAYLQQPRYEHPFLADWKRSWSSAGGTEQEARKIADEFQSLVLAVMEEKNELDAENAVASKNYKPREDAERAVLPGGDIVYDNFCRRLAN